MPSAILSGVPLKSIVLGIDPSDYTGFRHGFGQFRRDVGVEQKTAHEKSMVIVMGAPFRPSHRTAPRTAPSSAIARLLFEVRVFGNPIPLFRGKARLQMCNPLLPQVPIGEPTVLCRDHMADLSARRQWVACERVST